VTLRGTPGVPHLGGIERSAERPARPDRNRLSSFFRPRTISRPSAKRTLASLIALAVAAIALAINPAHGLAQAPEPQTTLPDVEDEVMCPVCGTTLELASESPQAIREREFIRDLIAEGRTKEEIKDALVAEFGDEVLALPEDEGFDLAAWLVPGLAIAAAAVAIFVGLRRWRSASEADEPGQAAEPLDAEEAGRLDADLKRYGR
jgi:cytochrome c-type biogenesis protein CcmH